jgi:hypothetical protein
MRAALLPGVSRRTAPRVHTSPQPPALHDRGTTTVLRQTSSSAAAVERAAAPLQRSRQQVGQGADRLWQPLLACQAAKGAAAARAGRAHGTSRAVAAEQQVAAMKQVGVGVGCCDGMRLMQLHGECTAMLRLLRGVHRAPHVQLARSNRCLNRAFGCVGALLLRLRRRSFTGWRGHTPARQA